MDKSEQINELAKALNIVQGAMQPAPMDSKNPFFKSKYASLNSIWDACRELLRENGLAVIQTNIPSETGVVIETILTHSSGQWISGCLYLPVVKHDPQGFGSAITYGRRYALASTLGIVSDEDDDGNHASQKQKTSQTNQQSTQHTTHQQLDVNFGGYTDGFPDNPIARSLSDLVTAKQLGMIRAIVRELGIDADEECNAVMKCKTDELSKKAASAFIGYLKDDKPRELAEQEQPISQPVVDNVLGVDNVLIERIKKAKTAIRDLGVEPFELKVGESAGDYFAKLTKQYKAISAPTDEPEKKTANKANTAQKKGKSNGMVTEKQLSDLRAIVDTSDLSETDICETETDNKKSKFSELTEIEAGQIIISLS